MAEETGNMALWRLQLPELELDVVHRTGVAHQAAYALYRLYTTFPETNFIKRSVPPYLHRRQSMDNKGIQLQRLRKLTWNAGSHDHILQEDTQFWEFYYNCRQNRKVV